MKQAGSTLKRDELTNNLLDRVEELEREVRRLRGGSIPDRLQALEERVRKLELSLAPGGLVFTIPEPETGLLFQAVVRDYGPPRGRLMVLRQV